jgi:hypothetical protein
MLYKPDSLSIAGYFPSNTVLHTSTGTSKVGTEPWWWTRRQHSRVLTQVEIWWMKPRSQVDAGDIHFGLSGFI